MSGEETLLKIKRKSLRQVQQLLKVGGHNNVAPAAFRLEKMTDEQRNSNNSNSSSNNKKNKNNNNNKSSSNNNNNNNNISNSISNASNNINNNNNSNNNNHSTSNNTSNINSERIIAEAAKILLKNGLNVTNAAAAATLLTAAATFQLPAAPPPPPPPLFPVPLGGVTSINKPTKTPSTSSASSIATEPIATPSESSATLTTNGLLPPTTKQHTASEPPNQASSLSSSTSSHAMATVTAANAIVAATPKTNIGVIDYTINSVVGGTVTTVSSSAKSVNSLQKYSGGNNHHFDTGRQPITNASGSNSYGGRLQFFKDGKFILELARSKDGEKGGWVSVPRKSFRAPSAATSATVTPTSAAPTPTYPKNENSTSLSFSDDNSSIQSSPWQRDHSWKQLRPRRGISKEMTLFYQRPKNIVLTKSGLKTAAKKRRKPYENTKTVVVESFECLDKPKVVEAVTVVVAGEEKTPKKDEDEKDDKLKSLKIETKLEIKDDELETNNKEDTKEVVVKVKNENEICRSDDCTDGEGIGGSTTTKKVPPPMVLQTTEKGKADLKLKAEIKSEESKKKGDESKEGDDNVVEKMNTSEHHDDDDAMSVTVDEELPPVEKKENGTDVDELDSKTTSIESCVTTLVARNKQESSNCCLIVEKKVTAENVYKRLIKQPKSRAKLSTIIQKLIDTVPARLEQLSKTPVVNSSMSGNGGGATNSLNHHSLVGHKVSPPSSAATRLVEYHQQHVSPRKRILRELEKVSLEDNHVNNGGGGAGGKRSRAKANSITGTTPKSSPSRSSASPMLTPTAASTYTAGSIGSNHSTAGATQTTITAATPPPPQPKRLNSSYSIHSLLGGSSSSSSSSSSRKTYDQPATIISNVPQHHALQHTNSSYQRTLLASPKSPEAASIGGGKSPSHASSNRKRSPPYVATNSPIHHHDTHSRSPHSAAGALGNDFGRRTPPETYKLPLNHHQPHPMHQTFYPPYALSSSQFVPAPGMVHSPPMSSTRIPLTSTASSVGSTLSSSLSTTSHILSPHIPHAASLASRDLSPPRSSTASPREPVTTPRTVPKKTASIRREFASPTASSSSTTTSCPSPSDRSHNAASPERRTNNTSQHNAAAVGNSTTQHHHLQRSSPTTAAHAAAAAAVAAAAVGSPLHYYMYPPQANGATSPHTSSSSASAIPTSHAATTNNNAAAVAAAAAAAAAYIPSAVTPSLYHPYISTLAALRHNPLWLHHYQAASTPLMPPAHQSGVGVSPSPFHPFAAYNGVGAAAVAAAAAAAAFGQPPTTHLPQSSAVLSPHVSSAPPPPVAMQQHTSTSAAALQNLHHQQQHHHHQQHQQHHHHHHMNSVNAERRNQAPKLTDISTAAAESIEVATSSMQRSPVALPPPTSLSSGSRNLYSPASSSGSGSTAHYHSMRDELSSEDVPLNLSKH